MTDKQESIEKQTVVDTTVTTEVKQEQSPVKSEQGKQSEEHSDVQPEPHFGNFLEQHESQQPSPPSPTSKPPTTVLTPPQLSPPKPTVSSPTQTPNPPPALVPPPLPKQQLAVAEPPAADKKPNSSNSLDVEKDSNQDHEKQQELLPPIPTAEQEHRSRKLSELMTLAYKERKEINRTEFQSLCKRRTQYYERHVGVLDNATFQLLTKIKQTNEFVPCVLKYLNQLGDTYKSFHEHLKKMSAFKFMMEPPDTKKAPDNRLNWSKEVNKGIKSMLELKDETSGKMKAMEVSLTNTLAASLDKSLIDYNKRLEHQQKLVDKQKSKYKDAEEDVGKRVKKVNKMLSEEQSEKDRKDLLVAELQVFGEFSKAKKELTEWGNALMTFWGEIINAEKILVCEIKKSMLNLLELLGQLHSLTDKQKQSQTYWKQLNVDEQVNKKFSTSNILPIAQYDFLKLTMASLYDLSNTSQITFEHWQTFNSLSQQTKSMGDRRTLIPTLILKKFDCQMDGKRKVTVVSTVDQFLVIYDEDLNCINKMQLKRLINTRKTEYEVNVNEKIEGFIVDSWNRETIHFKSPDTAEEFMFYTEKSPEIKKEYVK